MFLTYEEEQRGITERVTSLNNLLEGLISKSVTADKSILAVKKYTRIKKLTIRMLNELIDHIDVYHEEIIDGAKVQKLTIYYNCIGSIEIPENVPLEIPEITMRTRKGVTVTYQPNPLVAAAM